MATTHNHAFFNAMDCPTAVTWTKDIQKMFTPLDVDHMTPMEALTLLAELKNSL